MLSIISYGCHCRMPNLVRLTTSLEYYNTTVLQYGVKIEFFSRIIFKTVVKKKVQADEQGSGSRPNRRQGFAQPPCQAPGAWTKQPSLHQHSHSVSAVHTLS